MRSYFKIFLCLITYVIPSLVFPFSSDLTNRDTIRGDIIITPPKKRTIDPNSFPTFVFKLHNTSNKRLEPDFNLLLPKAWNVISFKRSGVIDLQKEEKVWITFTVPKYASASRFHKIGLITTYNTFSDTSFVKIRIRPKPTVKIMSFIEEKWIVPGKVDTLKYVLRNDGNLKDIFLLSAKLPEGWKFIELKKKYLLSPKENADVHLLFKVPKSAVPSVVNSIILTATSLVAKKLGVDATDENITRINVIKTQKRKVMKSLHPSIPLNIGFSINRIKKGEYPGIQIFANTGVVSFKNYSVKMELSQRLNSVPLEQTPQMFTDRVRFEIGTKKFNILLGDVQVETNPLMTRSSPLALAGYHPMGETGRGCWVGYKLNKADFSVFQGKRIYSDYSITSANANYQPSETVSFSSTYLGNNESHLMTMEGLVNFHNSSSIGALLGVSKAKENGQLSGKSAQLRTITKIKSMHLLGRVHWADDYYCGQDKGQYGAVFTARWIPTTYLYLWGNYHAYRKNYDLSQGDSSVFVNNFRTRFLFHPVNWPILNIGLNTRRDLYSTGYETIINSYDFQIRKQFKFGCPSLYFKKEHTLNPIYKDQQERYEFKVEWVSYSRWMRMRLGQNFSGVNKSPLSSLSSFDVNFNFRSILLGIFMSTGKTWLENTYDIYEARKITRYGFRTNFRIKPFGKNYNLRLEINKSDYENDWTIVASLSTGSVSMLHLPVPFIKTKGKISGEIFIDKNGNGIRDVNERGVAQLLLFLKDENVLTDGDGKFEFPAVAPGEYPFLVDLATLPAYLGLAKPVPKTISIRKGSDIYLQIPISSMCSINGNVFLDEDRNGKMNTEEKKLSMIRVILQNGNNQEREAYTNEKGYFTFPDLLPGVYTIKIDSRWLPNRRLPSKEKSTAVLSQREPHQTVNLAVVKKKLQIKKTFIAGKFGNKFILSNSKKDNSGETNKEEKRVYVPQVETENGMASQGGIAYSDTVVEQLSKKIQKMKGEFDQQMRRIKDLQLQMKANDKAINEIQGGYTEHSGRYFDATNQKNFKENYEISLKKFNAGQYRDAIRILNGLMTSNPNHPLASNCQYWIGECFYALGEYRNAVDAFSAVLTHSSSYKFDDALLMSGLCQLKLGNRISAKENFRQLVNRFPYSEYAKKAMRYLSRF